MTGACWAGAGGVRRALPRSRSLRLCSPGCAALQQRDADPDPLRQRVRNTILEQDRPLYDDFAVEALATLGTDLDERAEQWLRKVADDRPSSLYPVTEAPITVVSMAQDKPGPASGAERGVLHRAPRRGPIRLAGQCVRGRAVPATIVMDSSSGSGRRRPLGTTVHSSGC